jgi:hypothetical protein
MKELHSLYDRYQGLEVAFFFANWIITAYHPYSYSFS